VYDVRSKTRYVEIDVLVTVTPDASVMYPVTVVGTLTVIVDAAFGAGCVETTVVVTVAGGTTEVSVLFLTEVTVCGGA
jgi:hypothetical protein